MSFFKKNIITLLAILFILSPIIVSAKTSNDPLVDQWSYEDTGVKNAWNITTGSKNVVVAIIDNGFDYQHPDLRDNVWKNEDEIAGNNIDDDNNGYIDDVYGWNFVPEDLNGDGKISYKESKGNNNPRPRMGNLTPIELEEGIFDHGSVVAGIIGAVGNNEKFGSGVNWKVKLMNIKIVDNTGVGSLKYIARAIRYAVDNGADVINMSIISNDKPNDLLLAMRYANRKGVVMVAAAGNSMNQLNDSPVYPICIDADSSKELVIGVSAMDESHRLAYFSNIGSGCIDITAPGVEISSTLRYAPSEGLSEYYGGGWSGTSFAAPFVTGAVALVKSVRPYWTPDKIYQALVSTVHHTPNQDEEMYANLFGAGLLQIDKAVEYAKKGLKKD